MKPNRRMRGYLVVIAVLGAAVLLRPGGEAQSGGVGIVEAVARPEAAQQLPHIQQRSAALPLALFEPASQALPEPAPAPPETVVIPPAPQPPELIILGWMHSGATRHVFVEWREENYALAPSATLADTYRFEGIDQGMAQFTYLPDGTSRMFRVGDLDTAE